MLDVEVNPQLGGCRVAEVVLTTDRDHGNPQTEREAGLVVHTAAVEEVRRGAPTTRLTQEPDVRPAAGSDDVATSSADARTRLRRGSRV